MGREWRRRKKHKAANLYLERQQAFPPVKDSTRNHTSSIALGEKDRPEGVGALAQEGETGTAIRVSRNEVKVDSEPATESETR